MDTKPRSLKRRRLWGLLLCGLATFFIVGPARAFGPMFPAARGAPTVITNGALVTAALLLGGVSLSWYGFADDKGGPGHRWLMSARVAGLGCALGALVGIVLALF